ncbi:HNH endonuclease [Streptomyces sp. NPDC059989]|uniref:HNH endonuclease n=1 Tax=Streptomyces sp. NPDC059989 TaxID=3347026 RepID=UPI0036BC4861
MEPSDRGSLPRTVRDCVLNANGEGCTYCLWVNAAAVDHLVPLDEGGRDDVTNLVPACRSCNSSKRNRSVGQWRRDIAARPAAVPDVLTSFLVPSREYHDPDRVVDMSRGDLDRHVTRVQDEVVALFREQYEASEVERIIDVFNGLFNRMGSLSPRTRALVREEMELRLAGQEELLEAEPVVRRLALYRADIRQMDRRRQVKSPQVHSG